MAEPTLKQLRSLTAIVRHGSIAEAGRQLHITAPALGQQLRLLEKSIGSPLIERTPQGLRTTTAGQEVLQTAARIETELLSCADQIALLRSGKAGKVRLGTVSTAKYFAPKLLATFWRDHPSIDIELVAGNRHDTLCAISDFSVDIAITGRPPDELELDSAVIGPNPHVVIASPDHPLAHQKDVSISRICEERFIVREPQSGTRILTNWLFATESLLPTIVMEVQSNETIKQAVMAGLGVALLSAHTASFELAEGRLISLDVERTPIVRKWHAVRRTPGQLSPAGDLFWEFLLNETQHHLPSIGTLAT